MACLVMNIGKGCIYFSAFIKVRTAVVLPDDVTLPTHAKHEEAKRKGMSSLNLMSVM